MKIIGDYWILSIIRVLGEGELRFCEIERGIEGINPVTLTNRLKKLEETGFLQRFEEAMGKQSVTYKLTKKGQGMLPIIASIETFSATFGEC